MALNAEQSHEQRSTLLKGAGMAFLGRTGAVIEALSLPLFAWTYGAPALGLYFTLAGVIRMLSEFGAFGMTSALQRFVPAAKSEAEAAGVLRIALGSSALFSALLAAILALASPLFSHFFNASDADRAHLSGILLFFIWTLPLTVILEVATSAIRALRKFGPEVRVRVFYEQILRLGFGLLFFWFGWKSWGLFLANFLSLAVSCLLAIRLLQRYFNFRLALKVRANPAMTRRMLMFGLPMMPTNTFRMFHSELPVLVLNLIVPGAQGAIAAGIYGTGRKIVSALYAIRQSLEYVMAPLAAARAGDDTKHLLLDMIRYSTRLSLSLFILGCGYLILVRDDVLVLFSPEFSEAGKVIVILSCGRLLQALSGPANSVIDMLGHYLEPLLFSALGIVLMIAIQAGMDKEDGAVGAALASSAGLALTSALCLWRQIAALKLSPYSSAMWRPVGIACALAGASAAVSYLTGDSGPLLHSASLTIMFLVSIAILFKWGFSAADRSVYGRQKTAVQ